MPALEEQAAAPALLESEVRHMHEAILAHFPAHVHPLTLVSDPDGLLADEEVLAALSARGFVLVNEPDPVRLRYRVEQEQPFGHCRGEPPRSPSLIVVTSGPLNQLPYDLWQRGHRVELALHTFFPDLAYPVVRLLSPSQRLALCRGRPPRLPQPPCLPQRRLGRQGTIDYLLRHVFHADLSRLLSPAELVHWLNAYHQRHDPMPSLLAERLLSQLRALPAYADWPLEEVLRDREAFHRFVRGQWAAFVSRQAGPLVREAEAPYLLPFAEDEGLQDALPALVRSGALVAVPVRDPRRLPAWARPGVQREGESRLAQRVGELLELLCEQLGAAPEEARWEHWQGIAWTWAELQVLVQSDGGRLARQARDEYLRTCGRLDVAFLQWLRARYAPLAVQRLPTPHHVHHVPDYLAYRTRQTGAERVALLVMDGLSLADWQLIRGEWRARHPAWRLEEQLVLAQVPTVTSLSRQALVSGLRPNDFADTLDSRHIEARRRTDFWAGQGLGAQACAYALLALDRDEVPAQSHDSRIRALCLVDGSIDELLHGASLGAADVQASLRVWLTEYSPRLEKLLGELLAEGFALYLASDHGHVEARGMGQPSEGVTVITRGKRARVYSDPYALQRVRQAFPRTVLWEKDGLLPQGLSVLMPEDRLAFAPYNDIVVTHGGLTLEEVVVPLVTITEA